MAKKYLLCILMLLLFAYAVKAENNVAGNISWKTFKIGRFQENEEDYLIVSIMWRNESDLPTSYNDNICIEAFQSWELDKVSISDAPECENKKALPGCGTIQHEVFRITDANKHVDIYVYTINPIIPYQNYNVFTVDLSDIEIDSSYKPYIRIFERIASEGLWSR